MEEQIESKPTEVAKPEQTPEKITPAKLYKLKLQELADRELAIKRQEEELAEIITVTQLGGRSEAGVKVEEKEETPAEYAKRVMRGDYGRKAKA